MSENRQLSHHGRDKRDEESDIPSIKQQQNGQDKNDEESDIPSTKQQQKLFKRKTGKINKATNLDSIKSKAHQTSANAALRNTIDMIDTFDRSARASTEGWYAKKGSFVAAFENKPGKRIPKAGVYAETGVGRARAEFSVFKAEAKGPNASAGASASVTGAGAMARAEITSASAKAGPVGVKVGPGLDTGLSVGLGGLEVKVLGSGVSVGPILGVAVLGSEVKVPCSVM